MAKPFIDTWHDRTDAKKLEAASAMLAALERLADAADDVGVHHYDTDTMDPEVAEMQSATEDARVAIATAKAAGIGS